MPLGRVGGAGVDRFASGEGRGERMFVHPDAEVHPSVKLTGPVWIGAGACVAAGAELGPEVAVELDDLVLFESVFERTGAQHVPLARVELGG